MSMQKKMPFNPNLILTPGTQVVTRVSRKVGGRDEPIPIGTVGVVEEAPLDNFHSYRVRFPDGAVAALKRNQFTIRRHQHEDALAGRPGVLSDFDIHAEHIIYRCVVGSRAYGLAEEDSDCDRRGVFLPPAELHWSLYGVPEQLEDQETEECYWELEKFLVLALKANPNILECLWTPIVEEAKPVARELLDMRECFLSKVVYQTYNGYVISQFKKLEQDLRNRGEIKLKHAMHLIRLLISGVVALREKRIMVDVAGHRDRLLAVRRGEMQWDEINSWRLGLHKDFEAAFKATDLPERPDYDRANDYLVRARRSMVEPQ